jgi:DNA-binding CsgD family transcriptional regulator
MKNIKHLFIPQNLVEDIKNEDYQIADILVKTHEAIARMTYKSLYIIDYFKKNFLYVSDNPLFLCGNTADEVKENGYSHYMENVPDEEFLLLEEINRAGFDFFEKTPHEDRYKYTISCDFYIKNGKKKILINHKLTPILLTKEGKVWLASCLVSLSPGNKSGNVEIRKSGQMLFWRYSFENHRWNEITGLALNNIEKEILILSKQGLTMIEIADKLCFGIDSIKSHKKNIFKRLGVKNVAEAIAFAECYKLL